MSFHGRRSQRDAGARPLPHGHFKGIEHVIGRDALDAIRSYPALELPERGLPRVLIDGGAGSVRRLTKELLERHRRKSPVPVASPFCLGMQQCYMTRRPGPSHARRRGLAQVFDLARICSGVSRTDTTSSLAPTKAMTVLLSSGTQHMLLAWPRLTQTGRLLSNVSSIQSRIFRSVGSVPLLIAALHSTTSTACSGPPAQRLRPA